MRVICRGTLGLENMKEERQGGYNFFIFEPILEDLDI